MPRIALDTSVIIEYIDRNAQFQEQASAVFASLLSDEIEAIIPIPILSETFYVSAKIYEKMGVSEPEETSEDLVEWLFRLPTVTVPAASKDLATEAGRARLRYCLSLTDCYVLAASQVYKCKALFKKPESEMIPKIGHLKQAYSIVFLEDYR